VENSIIAGIYLYKYENIYYLLRNWSKKLGINTYFAESQNTEYFGLIYKGKSDIKFIFLHYCIEHDLIRIVSESDRITVQHNCWITFAVFRLVDLLLRRWNAITSLGVLPFKNKLEKFDQTSLYYYLHDDRLKQNWC
jgi:hypothetical protein